MSSASGWFGDCEVCSAGTWDCWTLFIGRLVFCCLPIPVGNVTGADLDSSCQSVAFGIDIAGGWLVCGVEVDAGADIASL